MAFSTDWKTDAQAACERLLQLGAAITSAGIERQQPTSFLIEGPFYRQRDGRIVTDVSRLQLLGCPEWEVVSESRDGSYDLWHCGQLKLVCASVDEVVKALRDIAVREGDNRGKRGGITPAV